jgi:hypothetical protein
VNSANVSAAYAVPLHPRQFVWTAIADQILVKVPWVEGDVKELVANNSNNAGSEPPPYSTGSASMAMSAFRAGPDFRSVSP